MLLLICFLDFVDIVTGNCVEYCDIMIFVVIVSANFNFVLSMTRHLCRI